MTTTRSRVDVTDRTPAMPALHASHSARGVGIAGFLMLLAALLGACGTSTSGASSTVAPLPSELDTAVTAMMTASSYSFTATVDSGSSSITIDGRFQAPDRIEQTVTGAGSAPVTMILDGRSVHLKDPSTGVWTTTPTAATAAVDLRSAFVAISGADDVEVSGDSTTLHLPAEQTRRLAGPEATGAADVTVIIGPDGISRLAYSVTMQGHPVAVSIAYSDIGRAAPVSIPS